MGPRATLDVLEKGQLSLNLSTCFCHVLETVRIILGHILVTSYNSYSEIHQTHNFFYEMFPNALTKQILSAVLGTGSESETITHNKFSTVLQPQHTIMQTGPNSCR